MRHGIIGLNPENSIIPKDNLGCKEITRLTKRAEGKPPPCCRNPSWERNTRVNLDTHIYINRNLPLRRRERLTDGKARLRKGGDGREGGGPARLGPAGPAQARPPQRAAAAQARPCAGQTAAPPDEEGRQRLPASAVKSTGTHRLSSTQSLHHPDGALLPGSKMAPAEVRGAR